MRRRPSMKFEIVNSKLNDSIIIEGKTLSVCRDKTNLEMEKRGWKREDCFSIKEAENVD
jgi:hypothetical protein